MNNSQQGILWIGLIIVMIFLFTDQNFRNSIFKKGTTLISSSGTSNKAPYTLAQILAVPTQPQQPTVNLV